MGALLGKSREQSSIGTNFMILYYIQGVTEKSDRRVVGTYVGVINVVFIRSSSRRSNTSRLIHKLVLKYSGSSPGGVEIRRARVNLVIRLN